MNTCRLRWSYSESPLGRRELILILEHFDRWFDPSSVGNNLPNCLSNSLRVGQVQDTYNKNTASKECSLFCNELNIKNITIRHNQCETVSIKIANPDNPAHLELKISIKRYKKIMPMNNLSNNLGPKTLSSRGHLPRSFHQDIP